MTWQLQFYQFWYLPVLTGQCPVLLCFGLENDSNLYKTDVLFEIIHIGCLLWNLPMLPEELIKNGKGKPKDCCCHYAVYNINVKILVNLIISLTCSANYCLYWFICLLHLWRSLILNSQGQTCSPVNKTFIGKLVLIKIYIQS